MDLECYLEWSKTHIVFYFETLWPYLKYFFFTALLEDYNLRFSYCDVSLLILTSRK